MILHFDFERFYRNCCKKFSYVLSTVQIKQQNPHQVQVSAFLCKQKKHSPSLLSHSSLLLLQSTCCFKKEKRFQGWTEQNIQFIGLWETGLCECCITWCFSNFGSFNRWGRTSYKYKWTHTQAHKHTYTHRQAIELLQLFVPGLYYWDEIWWNTSLDLQYKEQIAAFI